jgi:acyl-CoA thioester hydrolase
MARHVYRTQVRYNEVDQMGVVHNSIYYIYMELARVDLVRAEGYPYKRIEEEDGLLMPILESGCTYKHPARYDDILDVETTVKFVKNSSIRFNYVIKRDDGTLIAEGYTVHAAVDRNFEVAFIPDKYRDIFGKFLEPKQ